MSSSYQDKDGQPIAAFGKSRRRERDLHTLLGLLQGMVADKQLVDNEVLCLDIWLKNQGQEIADDPDVVDIVDLLTDILSARIATREQMQDLQNLISHVLECRIENLDADNHNNMLHTLLGMVQGLTADKVLKDIEIITLSKWLQSTAILTGDWTADLIRNRLKLILADGVVTDEERLEMLDILSAIVGGSFEEHGAFGGMATRGFSIDAEPLEEIVFLESNFVVTGKFLYGTRRVVTEAIQKRGGIVATKVSGKTDYLIVGTLASRDWLHSTHGLKVGDAMERKESGAQLKILGEEDWIPHLNRTPIIAAR